MFRPTRKEVRRAQFSAVLMLLITTTYVVGMSLTISSETGLRAVLLLCLSLVLGAGCYLLGNHAYNLTRLYKMLPLIYIMTDEQLASMYTTAQWKREPVLVKRAVIREMWRRADNKSRAGSQIDLAW